MKGARTPIAEIARHRALTEKRLQQLLPKHERAGATAEIKQIIFEEDGERATFNAYVIAMIDRFGDDDALIAVFQDAWNLFPHRRLNGRCPTEVFLELSPETKPEDLLPHR